MERRQSREYREAAGSGRCVDFGGILWVGCIE
jgi:hypothetical protein